MTYLLGIDLGTSSLGWCCLKLENDEIKGILDLGVRIFPDGRTDKAKTPLCVIRRNARSARRRLNRYKQRQAQLIAKLREFGLLPERQIEFKELEKLNPYKLRAEALHRQLSLYELGRAIFHLNQRRGFLSNRKDEKDQKSSTKTAIAMKTLSSRIKEFDSQTLGEYMYKSGEYRFKNATNTNGKLIIEIYPNREMYKDEFNKIWEYQQQYYPNILTDERKEEMRDRIIFYQRPLKKQETGFCSLEPEEKRAPKAYMIAQRFRILSDIANLEINYPEHRKLDKDERKKLFYLLDNPFPPLYDDDYRVSFEQIIKHLKLSQDTIFNLIKSNKKGLLCNITAAILNDEKTLGKYWSGLTLDQQNEIVDILCDYTLSKEDIEERLEDICVGISQTELDETIKQSLFLPEKHANLSAKAMGKLIENMRSCVSDYAEARESVYHKNVSDGQYFEQKEELPKYQELFPEQLVGGDQKQFDKTLDYDNYKGRITNVSVHIALNQLRHVVNDLLKKYGRPSRITIELGRELTKGKKVLDKIEKKQKENTEIISEAKSALRTLGISPTPFNIEKYKIWRNLNPKDVTKRLDVYTGKLIKITDLFDKGYDIEHILPYSWTYDDSYNNKIITRANVNRKKSNQLPYDFFSDENQLRTIAKDQAGLEAMRLDKVIERIKDVDRANGKIKKTFNFSAMSWRFSKSARDIFNHNYKNMARDLSDMQYMSKLAKKYLTCICDYNKIIAAKGQVTDLLKKVWNLSAALPEDRKLWHPQKWQKGYLLTIKKDEILRENPDWTEDQIKQQAEKDIKELTEAEIHEQTRLKKDRSNHYHHALDAFILANINAGLISQISSEKLANDAEKYYEEKKQADKAITLNQAREEVLKQIDGIYGKPYSAFDRNELMRKINNITVSYKQSIDKLKSIQHKSQKTGQNFSHFGFAPITEDTAFGFRKILKIDKGIEMEFSVRKNKKKGLEKHSLSTMVPVFRTKEQKRDFLEMYALWQRTRVRKEYEGEEKYKKIEEAFIKTFSKDKAYKWYASTGNYGAQIYQINKNDKFFPNKKNAWSMEILSNFYAFERQGRFFWKDIYPTAKRITSLRINDVIEAVFQKDDALDKGFSNIKDWIKAQFENNPEEQQLRLLFRVKKMSGGSLFLRPLHIAQEDGDTKSWQCNVNKFKQYQCRKVYITPSGNILRG